ncbi:MAG: hypothetical protein LQ345_002565 [Seirophora villosa]|nr:MAG: hypothetical protein LQ345_002565 [Seirophora villosa]
MTPNADFVRRTNLPHILEDSDGSLSWILEPSPKPENGPNKSPARASRPEQLGLGTTGGNLQVNVQQYGGGPRSAPPQIHSFEQAEAYNSNRGPWNDSASDSRWLRNPEEMQRQGSSNVTSAYPSSTHLELLAAQFGIKEGTQTGPQGPAYVERRPSTQGPQTGISSFQAPQGHQVPPSIFPGRGFDNLRAYVEMAADGQSRNVVNELEDLMTTMLYLRGEGDALPSMRHFGRDALRQFLYKSVFGAEDGSSTFSRENPTGRIEVAGRFIPRRALHEEIVHFLENQVELMMATPEESDQSRVPSSALPLRKTSNNSQDAENEVYESRSSRPTLQLAPQVQDAQQLSPGSVQRLASMNLGGHSQSTNPRQVWDSPAVAGGSENLERHYPRQQNTGSVPAVGQGLPPTFGSMYGEAALQQQYFSLMQQQYGQSPGIFPPQLVAPPGIMQGPSYMAPQHHAPMAYYPGRQLNPQAGAFLPYGPPYFPNAGLGMHGVMGHPMQQQYLPNSAMAFNPMAQQMPPFMTAQIPYSLTKQEVLGFLGRNAKILTSDIGVPIHIIMDRTNGKTMDCYVEFFSHGDAQAAFNKCLLRGNQLRLGDRVVDVSMSTQDELLKEMFPKAKNVTWSHGRPIVRESNDPYNSGFKAFVTNEELLQLVGYAEKPHRSNYTQKCLQRPYESMISLLSKFPWFAVDRYTLRTRDEIYRQTLRLIVLLVDQLRRGHEAYLPHLSESLLTELLYAGLNAPAFSEQQRWQLCQAGGPAGERIRMSPLAPYWPFDVLGRKAGVDEDVVREYAKYLQSHPRNTSIDGAFGTWTAESNEALGLTTIGQVGAHEMQMVLSMLQDVLSPRTL